MPFRMDTTDGEDHSSFMTGKSSTPPAKTRGRALVAPSFTTRGRSRSRVVPVAPLARPQYPVKRAARRRPTLSLDRAPACEAGRRPRRRSSVVPLISMASLPASTARPSRDGLHEHHAAVGFNVIEPRSAFMTSSTRESPPSTSLIVALASTQMCAPPASAVIAPETTSVAASSTGATTIGMTVEALSPSASVVTSTLISSAP